MNNSPIRDEIICVQGRICEIPRDRHSLVLDIQGNTYHVHTGHIDFEVLKKLCNNTAYLEMHKVNDYITLRDVIFKY